MTEKRAEHLAILRLIEALVVIVTVPIMLAMGGWAMATIVRHDNELSILKAQAAIGSRYTAEMAAKDFAGVIEKLDDHELRIRGVEAITGKYHR